MKYADVRAQAQLVMTLEKVRLALTRQEEFAKKPDLIWTMNGVEFVGEAARALCNDTSASLKGLEARTAAALKVLGVDATEEEEE